jgi:rhamnogalacturonan endolyase
MAAVAGKLAKAAIVCACLAIPPLAKAEVRLVEDLQSLSLDNGAVRLAFAKQGKNAGTIVSLAYHGRELLGGGAGYLQAAFGAKSKSRPQWRVAVSRREPTLVEVSLTNDDPRCPFDLGAHYVVRSGETGFYGYLTVAHDATRSPGVHELAQYDFCLRADPKLFTVAAVDDSRIKPFPKPEELTRPHMVMDATYRLGDGSCYSKYFFAAEMDDRHRVHGMMGSGVGLWIVMPSHEHLNGGPEHQELTVHQTDTTPVLLRHATAAYYGAGVIRSDAKDGSWSKVSAPWFVYVNEAPTHQAL